MCSFGVVFFFAVTGLTLNHPQWFAKQQRTITAKGSLNTAWTKTPADADVKKLEIVEFLRATHGIHGALSDFRVDDRECDVSFKGPGYSADVFIDRAPEQALALFEWIGCVNENFIEQGKPAPIAVVVR